MSNIRVFAVSTLTIACGLVGFAFLAADEAVAGPGAEPAQLEPVTSPELGEGEVDRLSIPFTPEQMGVAVGGTPPIPVAEPTYVFVNMDGANLTCNGGDNAVSNSSIIACQYNFDGPYPAYGGTAAQRQSVIDAVEADWAPFNIAITTTRPAAGPYTMCMTGPANHPFGNGVLGIAPLDCQNYAANNIVFAFHSASQLGQFGANTQATTISQEVAHAYGLEHVDSGSDIMNPYSVGGNPSFTDSCLPIVTNGMPIVCGAQHQEFCNSGSQNSYQELLMMFGASDPDDEPPSVTVAYPSPGDVFEPGASFVIECVASDNQAVASVELWINSEKMGATKLAPPFEWDVTNIPEGSYDLYCIASDEWDNSAMSPVVTISVEDGGMPGTDTGADTDDPTDTGDPTTSGDSGGDSGEDGADSGGSEGGLGDEGGLPPGFGLDEADSGCACASDGPREPGWLLLTLLGLPLVRRRRAA